MEYEQPEPLDELFYRDPQWIAENGGFLHGNNVLFYFAQSPFFDRQSNNNSIFLQAISDARFSSWLANRENFQGQLSRIAGTEYVVAYDPIASNVRDKDGQVSSIWVIQKQARRKRAGQEDEVTPIAMYYVVGDAVYEAPTVAKLIGNRMLSTVISLEQMWCTAAALPLFSAAHGHRYVSPSDQQKQTTPHQYGKRPTLGPDESMRNTSPPVRPKTSTRSADYENSQLFFDALNLSRRYSKEYMDEAPLLGEPGNFRISRVREAHTKATETVTNEKQADMPVKHERTSPAAPPPIQTDVPQIISKKSAKGGEKSPTTPGGREKPRRRKSRPTVTPTDG